MAEIKVKYASVEQVVTDLENIGQMLQNRKLNVEFSKGQGSFPEEVKQLAEELNALGIALGDAIRKCSVIIAQAGKKMKACDESLKY